MGNNVLGAHAGLYRPAARRDRRQVQAAIMTDQFGQFLSSIEHTRFYSRGWHVENVRYFVDRLLVVIDQVDDLTMLSRQSNQCSAHQCLMPLANTISATSVEATAFA